MDAVIKTPIVIMAFKLNIEQLDWSYIPSEAIEIQRKLSKRILLEGDPDSANLIAGVDCSAYGNTGIMTGAICVWNREENTITESVYAVVETDFPYIPGLLGFREIPALIAAFNNLHSLPEAVICDGQGIAHMRRFGIASHLGLYLELPTIGCGKTRLVGTYDQPGAFKGSKSDLTYKGSFIGMAVRTRDNVNPVFVSPGHKCSIESAAKTVLAACTKYRLPEPIRAAHKLSGEILRKVNRKENV